MICADENFVVVLKKDSACVMCTVLATAIKELRGCIGLRKVFNCCLGSVA
jgi:hypothetical protein